MTGFVYLASPYTHESRVVREMRYLAACRAAARLMRDGHVVFSPIAHSHSIEVSGIGEPISGDFWKDQDIPVLRHASMLKVLRLEGWEQSSSIRWEIQTAKALYLPIEFIDPLPGDMELQRSGYDLVAHLERQKAFSLRTFGPGYRLDTVVAHIRKELQEVEENPRDVTEWADVMLLAMDGASRAGHSPVTIAQALEAKLTRNEQRQWPDWRKTTPGQVIQHIQIPEQQGEAHA